MQLLYKSQLMFTAPYDASNFVAMTPPDQLEQLQSEKKDIYSGKVTETVITVGDGLPCVTEGEDQLVLWR